MFHVLSRGSVNCGCKSLRKYHLSRRTKRDNNPESSSLLHKSQKFLRSYRCPHSDTYSSWLSHCVILTLTLDPVRAKTLNQEQGKSPVRRWFAKRPTHTLDFTPIPNSAANIQRGHSEHSWEECEQSPRLPPRLFTVLPFNAIVMVLGHLPHFLLLQRKHKSPSHAD